MAATASMRLLFRPVRRHAQLLGQVKMAFSWGSHPRNVFSCSNTQWVQREGGFRSFRCFSSAGDATPTHHHDNEEAASVEPSLMKSMANKIKDELSAETVIVKDLSGDGRHVSIYAVSSAFNGQSAVNRQRMVYKAIWEELQTTVHAVDHMITRTPAEAGLDN
ncbi:hypothetical protein Cgig2_022487 [Carnegiea gigantea]|uniref:BolA-like protein n=1 Tax=Carnegiea gigantea TaxID=171969 RepID=A0A9Q1QG83_9CARY|nr:hypothetical protein Cgig2_022487 [Carnegiea gigantea]